jgi:hypothetical protein
MGRNEIPKSKSKHKKKFKKINKHQRLDPIFLKTLPYEIQNDHSLLKYWNNRFRLFKKFNQGIKLDKGKTICIIVFIKLMFIYLVIIIDILYIASYKLYQYFNL